MGLHFKTEEEFRRFMQRGKPGQEEELEPERPQRRGASSAILSLVLWLSLMFTVSVLAATCFGGL